MKREDYIRELDAFQVHDVKTKAKRLIPCHPDFKPVLAKLPIRLDSPLMFINPRGHRKGNGSYNVITMEKIWNRACAKVGVKINLYAGTKHSSCSQLVNEKGLSVDQVQMLTEHTRRDTVLKYAKVELDTRRRLLAGDLGRQSVGSIPSEKAQ